MLLRAVVVNMGPDAERITDSRYDHYFRQGSAVAGVAAVIAAGKFRINGLPIPASEADYRQRTPAGYPVNQVTWLQYDAATGHWTGGFRGEQAATSYAAAALAVATAIVPGLEVRLLDTNNDGFADTIEADYKEGVQVQDIIRQADGSVRVLRGDLGPDPRSPEEGRVFDGAHFTASSGERIAARQFDARIMPGDVALFWWGPTGWVMQRAREVHGLFVDGSDHASYTVDRTAYQDAMHFSRDNLFISNRPGEFVNAQKFFVPSTDGADVPATQRWVPPPVHTQLRQAIGRAQAALDAAATSSSQLDYCVYLLYLTLNGSEDDIGAKFGGYRQPGFIFVAQAGRQPANAR